MAAVTMKHFDTLDYVEKSKALGVEENIAKYQARQFEQAIDIAVDTARSEIESKELATRQDIKDQGHSTIKDIQELRQTIQKDIQRISLELKELELSTKNNLSAAIAELKLDLIKWLLSTVLGTGFAIVVAIAGLLKYMH